MRKHPQQFSLTPESEDGAVIEEIKAVTAEHQVQERRGITMNKFIGILLVLVIIAPFVVRAIPRLWQHHQTHLVNQK